MSEWIKCTDRLPEEEQSVLIYFRNSAGWHVTHCFYDGRDFIDDCDYCSHYDIYHHDTPITHWQPLPEPPK